MSRTLLRRADQATIALLTAAALLGAVAWWLRHGGHRGGLVEIDNSPPLAYEYLVDVNQAEWPELAQLPGIGPTLAQRIVASRAAEGPYRSTDDLLRVDGIGPRTLDGMRRHLIPLVDDTQVAEGEAPPPSPAG